MKKFFKLYAGPGYPVSPDFQPPEVQGKQLVVTLVHEDYFSIRRPIQLPFEAVVLLAEQGTDSYKRAQFQIQGTILN